MSFRNLGELFAAANCTVEEKEKLIEQLALFRFKKTMKLIEQVKRDSQGESQT